MGKAMRVEFRIDADLRDKFYAEAKRRRQPAAQVLRRLMKSYVEAPEQYPAITELEREKRKKAADVARASVGLEGFKLSKEAEERIERFIEGEMDLQELVGGLTHDKKRKR